MAITDKLNSLAESIIESLRTTEVQLPLFGVAWACAAGWFPGVIPAAVDISWVTAVVPQPFGAVLPQAITPGWLIVCLPLICLAKTLTPGRRPFVPTGAKKEVADA